VPAPLLAALGRSRPPLPSPPRPSSDLRPPAAPPAPPRRPGSPPGRAGARRHDRPPQTVSQRRPPGSRSPAAASEKLFAAVDRVRSEEHTAELQSPYDLVWRLLLAKRKT